MMGVAFRSLGRTAAESILVATSNPFIGFLIGLLITALIQSSSTSTSMIVAIVASGSLTIEDAVPMVMGANIGTTLTSTIVSLGFINDKTEFRRAISAGVVHDFFNILTVIILFPLEIYYGLVSSGAQKIASLFFNPDITSGTTDYGFRLFDAMPLADYIVTFIDNGFISILLSFILLFASIKFFSNFISKQIIGQSQDRLLKYLFSHPFNSFLAGITLTAAVQSSSITTSLVVPFVATNKIKLQNATPFILGANIGTTITAFIAVLFESNAAISIAITHLLINIIGVLIFLPFPLLRQVPIFLAGYFGKLTMQHRLAGFMYIIAVFFAIPFVLIYFNRDSPKTLHLEYEIVNSSGTEIKHVSSKILNNIDPPLAQNEPSEEQYTLYRKNNVIFFNESFFLVGKPGSCWDEENDIGKFHTCVAQIIPSVGLDEGNTIDSVYVFEKFFFPNDSLRDSELHQYYISVPDLILYKKKQFKNGKLMITQTLTGFSAE